jgi:hypothetical protein
MQQIAGIPFPSEGIIALMIPILALTIPIVAILSKHQQSMAELLNSRRQGEGQDIEAMRRELSELKSLVHQQAIAIDNLTNLAPTPIHRTIDFSDSRTVG